MYAINSTQNGWRSINSVDDLLEGETYSDTQPLLPVPQPTYADLRRAAYPPLTDLIDGLVKDDAAQIQAYKDACLEVKALYPK